MRAFTASVFSARREDSEDFGEPLGLEQSLGQADGNQRIQLVHADRADEA
jgi:hypothetical protein